MRRTLVEVPGVPASPSSVAKAIVIGKTCHIFDQLAVYEDGYRPGSAREEAERAFELVFRVAREAGFESSEIVYVDLALADLDDLPEVDAVYARLFAMPPARTICQDTQLPFRAKVKVQAIAMKA